MQQPPDDWPPAGQCYFCLARRGEGPHWTCAAHRVWERYAHAVAQDFATAQATTGVDPHAESIESAVWDWMVTDEGKRSEARHDSLWSDDMREGEAVSARLMSLGLIAKKAEEGVAGSLPEESELKPTATERHNLLKVLLSDVEARASQARVGFTLDSLTEYQAQYTISRRGLLGGKRQARRVTVSDWGAISEVILR